MTQEFASLKEEVDNIHLYFQQCIRDALRKAIRHPKIQLNNKENANDETELSEAIDPLFTQDAVKLNLQNVSSSQVSNVSVKPTPRALILIVRISGQNPIAIAVPKQNTVNRTDASVGVSQLHLKCANGSKAFEFLSNLKEDVQLHNPSEMAAQSINWGESSEERTKRLQTRAEAARNRRRLETPEQRAKRLERRHKSGSDKQYNEKRKKRRVANSHIKLALDNGGAKRARLQPRKGKVRSMGGAVVHSESDEDPTTKIHPTNGEDNGLTEILCDICGKASTSKRGMEVHRKSHNSEDASNFECTICFKSFINRTSYAVHCKIFHSDNKPFKCKHCDGAWRFLRDLKNHTERRICLLKDEKKCEICGRKYLNAFVLAEHIKNVHEAASEDSGRVCDICGTSFSNRSIVLKHRLSHTHPDLKPFECLRCGSTFMSKTRLQDHSNRVHKNEELSFKMNEQYASLRAEIKRTKYKHNNKLNSGCTSKEDSNNENSLPDIVSSESSQPLELPHCEIHLETDRSTQDDNMIEIIACDTCGRKFSNQQIFDLHSKAHGKLTLNTELQCDICGKEFSRNYGMRQHRLTHSSEKHYICSTCGTRKKNRINMIQHYKTSHKDIKVIAYELNNVKYPLTRPLSAQLKIRVEGCSGKPIIQKVLRPESQKPQTEGNQCDDADKPNQSHIKMEITCDFCEEKFKNQDLFYRHTKAYSDDRLANRNRTFKCEFCDKGFKTEAILQDHRYIHTKEKPYKCSTCGVRTSQRTGMYQHYRLRHKNIKAAYQLDNSPPVSQKPSFSGRPRQGEGCPGKPII